MRPYKRSVTKGRPKKITRAGWEADFGTREPEPQLDWNGIREAKGAYCYHCLNFNGVLGGCRLYLTPSKKCPRFRRRGMNE